MRTVPPLIAASMALVLSACQPAATTAPQPQAAATPTPAAAPAHERVLFQCGELAVEATYVGDDRATVVFAGRTLQLEADIAASGAKYSDAQGNSLWTKGSDEGVLSLKGEPDRACQPRPQGSSGATAPARFHANGNEPGWSADVQPAVDGQPSLRVDVDYGERRFEVAAPAQGADGWIGKAADGTDIKLSFQRTACEDDMSGEAFDARAMLTVGTRQYHGCGSFAARP